MAKKKTPASKQHEYSLAERLKFIRETRKMTQAELAKNSDLTQATIANLESGRKSPSIETLEKLSEALDIHIATLFSSEDVYVFDLKRLRRKYTKADKLTPHLYMALGRVVQYARDISFI
jgi:transcriptional regulator with XRE-family HTH domain